MLESAARSVNKIGDKIEEIKRTDASKLQDEYEKLVAGLQDANDRREEEDMLANPGISVCTRVRFASTS
jgi:DNA excision repair protein ERCC-2